MKVCWTVLFLLLSTRCVSQTYTIAGKIYSENHLPAEVVTIELIGKSTFTLRSDTSGTFLFRNVLPGGYKITIHGLPYERYSDSINIINADVSYTVSLLSANHMLTDAQVIVKRQPVIVKDDTTEYYSYGYKVQAGADAVALLKKMAGIEINGKHISEHGEDILNVVVDGKPFFGNDAYATLKNLPAEIIDKIQVFNDKTEQEKFSGFHEENTVKTINIVTKASKRSGIFGTGYCSDGVDENSGHKYALGGNINKFDGDRRATLTAQSNNVGTQNFIDAATVDNATATGAQFNTNATGFNFSDKWMRNTDLSVSYLLNATNTTTIKETERDYVLPADSNEHYQEMEHSSGNIIVHNVSVHVNQKIDSLNSVLLSGNLSSNTNTSNSELAENTTQQLMSIGSSYNNIISQATNLNLSTNILYRHKFDKEKRTFSIQISTTYNKNQSATIHQAQNNYIIAPSATEMLNQQNTQKTENKNISASIVYTEPIGKNSAIKADYTQSSIQAGGVRVSDNYSSAAQAYIIPDALFTNSSQSHISSGKAGCSYQYQYKKFDYSFGGHFVLANIDVPKEPRENDTKQKYYSFLPVCSLRYSLSKKQSIQVNYNSTTQFPTGNQLQNTVNNTDPLHLYTGNELLKQAYQHTLIVRFHSAGRNNNSSFFVILNGDIYKDGVFTNSIIAKTDTIIDKITLHKGSQFSFPENINGYRYLHAQATYGQPLLKNKFRTNVSLNSSFIRNPSIINQLLNYQYSRNIGCGLSFNSNISEHTDFIISSNLNVNITSNSISETATSQYISSNNYLSCNIDLYRKFSVNSTIDFSYNSGQFHEGKSSYVLWNISFMKKMFGHDQGVVKIVCYNLLHNATNVQHTVTDTYITDIKTVATQSYILLNFTYIIRNFK